MKDLETLKALWELARNRNYSDYCAFNMQCQAIVAIFSEGQIMTQRRVLESKLQKREELSDVKIKEIIGNRDITVQYAMSTPAYLDFVRELNKNADKSKLEAQLKVINHILA